jgi:hypothetical protein
MKLPHLSRRVELDSGMAVLLYNALNTVYQELLYRDIDQQRWTTPEALSLKPLAKLTQRLQGLALTELQPRLPGKHKPHRLRIAFDEMTTIRLYYARLLATLEDNSHDQLLLAGALGRFHQQSTSLESQIHLMPTSGRRQ